MSIIFLISSLILLLLVPIFYKTIWAKYNTIAFLPGIFKILGILILIICVFAPGISGFNDFPIINEIKQLLIILGLIIISFSREKNENGVTNDKRIVSLFCSFVIVIVISQVLMIFNLFGIKEFTVANFSICVLASYLLVFHWFRRNAL